jgi:HTH-type transcriptional regulator / antitoxin HigA
MTTDVRTIRSEEDYEIALADVAALWGAANGTPDGDQLDLLATLIDAYESRHHAMEPPDPVKAIRFRLDQQAMNHRGS